MKTNVCTVVLTVLFMGCMTHTYAQAKSEEGYRVGAYEVYYVVENAGKGNKGILIDAPDSVMARYAPDGTYNNAVCAFLVRKGDSTWVIDTGFGRNLFSSMETLGMPPEKVPLVLLTHTHGDHVGGLMRNNAPTFPNAQVLLSYKEIDFWKAQGQRGPGEGLRLKGCHPAKLAPLDDFPSGIHPIEAYGHTPGHVVFLIKDGKEALLIWGDLVHAAAIQYPHPEISVRYDSDPVQA